MVKQKKGKAIIEVEAYPDGILWKLQRGIQLTPYEKQVLKTRDDLIDFLKKKYADNPDKLIELGIKPKWKKLKPEIVKEV